ncbi:D-alanyl-D-alanine carboxypeptidase family protein [Papillibacter cinnamivorans]|uniref:D-alanyl-D-alanine dipeptidase/carboxypeptidase n=1 Tax=Papillibacter cinnamivorans DSM 12816 TaxID=1122930 RepID=A0A1W2BEM7_9FIRM|nr:D-alanyl-D-alanine carboxypeptidase family protein [Papillibacter cinnamivorans]SMC71463.1 D-alanyl-D-alanine dipeptidase/carboxypeptidase [Papillibacter cinnamivorans DSM 12816]
MKTAVFPRETVYSGTLVLVNGSFPFRRQGMGPSLVSLGGENGAVLLSRGPAVLLTQLMDGLDGWKRIAAVSGWRSEREQRDIYVRSLRENGQEFTDHYVAKPGHSEHQTGLAVDLGLKQPEMDPIRPAFPYSGVCWSFRRQAALYGFVERYPAGKEAVTGIAHEPWHFRYVGAPHASVMAERGFTLEEYIDFVRQYPYGQKSFLYEKDGLSADISYIRAEDGPDTRVELDGEDPLSVSGDNAAGFVVTRRRKKYDA